MCDSYIGLDQVYNIDLDKINSKITSNVKIHTKLAKPSKKNVEEEYNDEDVWSDDEGNDGFESYKKLYEMGIKTDQKDEEGV